MWGLFNAKFDELGCKFFILLLPSIYGLFELANMTWLCFGVTWWELHIKLFINVTMKISIINIKFVY